MKQANLPSHKLLMPCVNQIQELRLLNYAENGVCEAIFYNWKKKYGGLGVSELRRLKQLEEENSKLKQLVADLSLDNKMLQDIIQKKL